MIVVPARKDCGLRSYGDLAIGEVFRLDEGGHFYLRVVGACYSLSTYQALLCGQSQTVIPARVILVEKGADLKDVADALEKL